MTSPEERAALRAALRKNLVNMPLNSTLMLVSEEPQCLWLYRDDVLSILDDLERAEREVELIRDGKYDDSWRRQCEENERLEAELAATKEELFVARACKPDEWTHVVASERMAQELRKNAEQERDQLRAELAAERERANAAVSTCAGSVLALCERGTNGVCAEPWESARKAVIALRERAERAEAALQTSVERWVDE